MFKDLKQINYGLKIVKSGIGLSLINKIYNDNK